MAKHKSLTFHYKKVKTNDNNNLQTILQSLNNLTVEQRLYSQGEKSYVLNHITEYEGMYYAEIICYEKDRMQSVVHTTPKDNNLNERNITTKDIVAIDENSNTPSEFVQSRIIFGLVENNLAINVSKVGLQTFVNYINFLLNTHYWKDPQNSHAILILEAYSKDLKNKLKTTHVRHVKIGQEVATKQNQNNRFDLKEHSLFHALGDLIKLPKGFKSDLDDANLRATLTLDYVRTTSNEGQKVLDDLTGALSTVDDSFVTILFADGTEFKGGSIRVKGTINQTHNEDKENSFDRIKMQKDIRTFLQQSLE